MHSHVRCLEAQTAVQPRRGGVIGSMQLTVTGKQIDVGDALRRHVEASLTSILAKYFGTAIEAHAVLAREAHLTRSEVSVHIGRGIEVNAHAVAQEIYAAFDAASDRVAKRLPRSSGVCAIITRKPVSAPPPVSARLTMSWLLSSKKQATRSLTGPSATPRR